MFLIKQLLCLILLISIVTTYETHKWKENPMRSKRSDSAETKSGVHWPQATIPYYLDTNDYDSQVGAQLDRVLQYLESASCVRFKSLTSPNQEDSSKWLHFANPKKEKKCVHQPVYEDSGEILVVLGFECLQWSQLMHSVLHGLGLHDEVTHPRRDQYVRILWENIQPEYRMLFSLNKDKESRQGDVEYDPLSVMHFHDRAFSANGRATILPQLPGLEISPSQSLSQLDQAKLRLIFGFECNRRDVGNLMEDCKMALNSKELDPPSSSIVKYDSNKKEINEKLFEIPDKYDTCYRTNLRQLKLEVDEEINKELNTYIDFLMESIRISIEIASRRVVMEKIETNPANVEKIIQTTVKNLANEIKESVIDAIHEVEIDFLNIDAVTSTKTLNAQAKKDKQKLNRLSQLFNSNTIGNATKAGLRGNARPRPDTVSINTRWEGVYRQI